MRLRLPSPSVSTWLQAFSLVVSLALTATPGSLAWAHGGEDHGDAPAPVNTATTPAAPHTSARTSSRTSARTDNFELVAVLQEAAAPTLTLYLDRADTNAPVEGASIDVESGAFKSTAKAVEPGIYTLPAGPLAQAGHHPLTITVQSADTADLLDATLDVGTTEAEAVHDHDAPGVAPSSSRKAWLAAATLLLIALTWAWRRRSAASSAHDKEAA